MRATWARKVASSGAVFFFDRRDLAVQQELGVRRPYTAHLHAQDGRRHRAGAAPVICGLADVVGAARHLDGQPREHDPLPQVPCDPSVAVLQSGIHVGQQRE